MNASELRDKMVDFMARNEHFPDILINKEQEPGRRVLGVIWLNDGGVVEWKKRVFDDNDELIAYDKDYAGMTDADISEFAKKINRYIDDHTR